MIKIKFERSSTPRATTSPFLLDIAWAAGVFEGEGHCCTISKAKPKGYPAVLVTVSQKDPWILYKFQTFFGGSVRQYTNGKQNPIWIWCVSGARGRGFLMTVFSFLSPRRKNQIKQTLYGLPDEQTQAQEAVSLAAPRRERAHARGITGPRAHEV